MRMRQEQHHEPHEANRRQQPRAKEVLVQRDIVHLDGGDERQAHRQQEVDDGAYDGPWFPGCEARNDRQEGHEGEARPGRDVPVGKLLLVSIMRCAQRPCANGCREYGAALTTS